MTDAVETTLATGKREFGPQTAPEASWMAGVDCQSRGAIGEPIASGRRLTAGRAAAGGLAAEQRRLTAGLIRGNA